METNLSVILIGICFAILILISFKKQVKYILQFAIRSAFGMLGFSIINMVTGSYIVGINLISVITVGFLGIPGFISLYILQFLI